MDRTVIKLLALTIGIIFMLMNGSVYAMQERYLSREEAEKDGCQFAALKGPGSINCFKVEPQDREIFVVVYDRTKASGFTKSQILIIPSWYLSATVISINVLSGGGDWLLVNTEGMRGTGVSQRILTVLAWNGERFCTVAVESGTYSCHPPSPDDRYTLTVTHAFASENAIPFLKLSYALSRNEQVVSIWTDILEWDSHSFKPVEFPLSNNIREPIVNVIRKRISEVRLYLRTHLIDLTKDSLMEWFNNSGVTDILLPECYP